MDTRAVDGWMIAMYIWLLVSGIVAGNESGFGWLVWSAVMSATWLPVVGIRTLAHADGAAGGHAGMTHWALEEAVGLTIFWSFIWALRFAYHVREDG